MISNALSFKERQKLHQIELAHGVIIRQSGDVMEAYRWHEDEPICEAPNLQEMEIVLKAMHIYGDDVN